MLMREPRTRCCQLAERVLLGGLELGVLERHQRDLARSAEQLGLAEGNSVTVLIKATEVMLGK